MDLKYIMGHHYFLKSIERPIFFKTIKISKGNAIGECILLIGDIIISIYNKDNLYLIFSFGFHLRSLRTLKFYLGRLHLFQYMDNQYMRVILIIDWV